MSWTIADAKQQFSEVVRLCAHEPQTVYKRARPVAAVISAEDYAAFDAWRRAQQATAALDVPGLFGPARQALIEAGADGLELPSRLDRHGADLDLPPDEPVDVAGGRTADSRDAAQ
ncbi:MAG: type II toxin-antitoxin system prevent-host-death family antitoxin [Rubrivivax sp.]